MLDPCDIGWLAGIIEGEGCITTTTKKQHRQPRVTVEMTDRDIIEKCAAVTGLGYIYTRKRAPYRPIYVWAVTTKLDVKALLVTIRPYMGTRRTARIDELLAEPALWKDGRRRV